MRDAVRAIVALSLAALVLAAACAAPTQATLELVSDPSCAALDIAIVAGSSLPIAQTKLSNTGYLPDRVLTRTQVLCAANKPNSDGIESLATLALTPAANAAARSGAGAVFVVVARSNATAKSCAALLLGGPRDANVPVPPLEDCMQLAATYNYRENATVNIRLRIDTECFGKRCSPGKTCKAGKCGSPVVLGPGGDPAVPDGGTGDSGASDAGSLLICSGGLAVKPVACAGTGEVCAKANGDRFCLASPTTCNGASEQRKVCCGSSKEARACCIENAQNTRLPLEQPSTTNEKVCPSNLDTACFDGQGKLCTSRGLSGQCNFDAALGFGACIASPLPFACANGAVVELRSCRAADPPFCASVNSGSVAVSCGATCAAPTVALCCPANQTNAEPNAFCCATEVAGVLLPVATNTDCQGQSATICSTIPNTPNLCGPGQTCIAAGEGWGRCE